MKRSAIRDDRTGDGLIPDYASLHPGYARPSIDLPCFFRQHDRDAVADRIGELGRTRDQFLPRRIEFERTLGYRAYQDLEQLRIDGAVEAFGRGIHMYGLR